MSLAMCSGVTGTSPNFRKSKKLKKNLLLKKLKRKIQPKKIRPSPGDNSSPS
jgi:hypothetical protein